MVANRRDTANLSLEAPSKGSVKSDRMNTRGNWLNEGMAALGAINQYRSMSAVRLSVSHGHIRVPCFDVLAPVMLDNMRSKLCRQASAISHLAFGRRILRRSLQCVPNRPLDTLCARSQTSQRTIYPDVSREPTVLIISERQHQFVEQLNAYVTLGSLMRIMSNHHTSAY